MVKAARAAKPQQKFLDSGLAAMNIKVRNFGPIAEGQVRLRPLTVFAGPSNTGKTWMATLIYVLGKYTQNDPNSLSYDPVSLSYQQYEYEQELFAKHLGKHSSLLKQLERWSDALNRKRSLQLTLNDIDLISKIVKARTATVIEELSDYFNVDFPKLTRYGSDINGTIEYKIGEITQSLELSAKSLKAIAQINLKENLKFPMHKSNMVKREYERIEEIISRGISGEEYYLSRFTERIYEEIINYLFNIQAYGGYGRYGRASPVNRRNQFHYLPAQRGGMIASQDTITSALVRSASMAGIKKEKQLQLLPKACGDFLANIIDIGNKTDKRPSRHRKYLQIFSEQVEDEILKGKVVIENTEIGYPSLVYYPISGKNNLRIPVMNSSSMVSELSPLVLFLRYTISRGDTLIIDEPESHLHPKAQRQLVNEIALWVNHGIQVILTTHSEWVIEELTNIVARGEQRSGEEQESKLSKSEPSLTKDDVGIWEFYHKNEEKLDKGSKIRRARWKLEKGGYEVGYYDTTAAQHNEWVRHVYASKKGGDQ